MTEERYENGENTEHVRYNQEVSVQGGRVEIFGVVRNVCCT